MNLFQKMMNYKLNTITTKELLSLAKQYGISITEEEAKKIAQFLNGKRYNIFQQKEKELVIQKIEEICGVKTAKEVEKLLNQLL